MKLISRLFIITCILFLIQPIKIDASGIGVTYSVNTRGDEGDSDLSDGICWNGIGEECTLRAAIEQANYDSTTHDTVVFNILSGLVLSKVISLDSALPELSSPISIQGPNISDGTQIVLYGQGLAFTGLTITSDNVLIDSINISHFGDYGIKVQGAENISILNCLIGKFIFNPIISGNGSHGIYLQNSSGVTIQDNLINDNGGEAILIEGGGENIIRGNIIGLDLTGSIAEPNLGNGIMIIGSDGNIIGGTTEEERNIISGNGQNGLLIEDDSSNNVIIGNFIGSDLGGTEIIANQMNGIELANAFETQIGGIGFGEANLILGNMGDGVAVTLSSLNNEIIGNAISMNSGLGINLVGKGEGQHSVTINDYGDSDVGANKLQNYPFIKDITYEDENMTLVLGGILFSSPSTSFTLHFYGNDAGDPSEFCEGLAYLGTDDIVTNARGRAEFNVTLPGDIIYACITATATDSFGNTSEFSSMEDVVYKTIFPLVIR